MRVSSGVTSASCASRVASGSARSSSSARAVCLVSTSDRIRSRRQRSSCGLRRRLRRAVLARDRFLADGDDALVDAIALKVGQPGRRRNRRERVDLIRRGTAQVDQPVGAGGRVVGRAERGSQQRVGAIVAVSREIGAHHRVGRLAQLRQQPAAADRIERGDERRGVGRAASGLRGQHIHRLLPASDGGRRAAPAARESPRREGARRFGAG